MTLQELERNDVNAAVDYYRQAVLDGTWDGDQSAILQQLQDDPTELRRRMDEVDQEPEVAAALA